MDDHFRTASVTFLDSLSYRRASGPAGLGEGEGDQLDHVLARRGIGQLAGLGRGKPALDPLPELTRPRPRRTVGRDAHDVPGGLGALGRRAPGNIIEEAGRPPDPLLAEQGPHPRLHLAHGTEDGQVLGLAPAGEGLVGEEEPERHPMLGAEAGIVVAGDHVPKRRPRRFGQVCVPHQRRVARELRLARQGRGLGRARRRGLRPGRCRG